MNWQILIGAFFLIGGLGNLTENLGAFLFGVAIGAALLYWGLKKKGIIKSRKTFSQVSNELHTLMEETFHATGVSYYESNIQKLANTNPEWTTPATQIIRSGKAGKRIYKNHYINKPVKLIPEPENPHDKNAIAIIIAGELVGYISREDNLHVKDILDNREIKSISGFIGGGEYKIVGEDSDVIRGEYGFSVNVRIKYV